MLSLVAARQQEFAVRTAVEAPSKRLVLQGLTGSFVIAALGSALGAIAAWYDSDSLLRFVELMLHHVSAYDPVTLAAGGATLVLVTILAAIVPALRAAKLNPIETLKAE